MKWDQAKAALELAATPMLERIRQDRARASWRIEPLVARIGAELFDADLTVGRLMRRCRVSNHNVSMRFRQELGDSPWQYITRRRLETATHLLSHSDLPISDIGALVGIPSASRFGETFWKWLGMTPSEYRAKLRESGQLATVSPALPEPQQWHLAEIGALDEESARQHLRRFLALYPQAGARPVPITIDGGALERLVAEEIWRQLETRSPEEQQAAIRHQLIFTSTAFFRLLSRESREEGRKDRQRGVYLAELALTSIEASAEALGEDAANYRAEAWARIGNANRLALDFPGADQAFERAKEAWQQPRDLCRVEVEAEIANLESSLRMNQRRFEVAAKLADRAVQLTRSLEQPSKLGQFLVQRGAVSLYGAEASDAARFYGEAYDLAQTAEEGFLEMVAGSGLSLALIATDRCQKAEMVIEQVQERCDHFGNSVYQGQIWWTRALLAQARNQALQAEEYLVKARAGFIRDREMDHAAVITLDLAALYLCQDRSTETLAVLTEVVPLFETLHIGREYLATVQLLRQALARQQVSRDLLRRVRTHLEGFLAVPPSFF